MNRLDAVKAFQDNQKRASEKWDRDHESIYKMPRTQLSQLAFEKMKQNTSAALERILISGIRANILQDMDNLKANIRKAGGIEAYKKTGLFKRHFQKSTTKTIDSDIEKWVEAKFEREVTHTIKSLKKLAVPSLSALKGLDKEEYEFLVRGPRDELADYVTGKPIAF